MQELTTDCMIQLLLRSSETEYVKAHESKYLSTRGDLWDLGPVWNRGIKQYFLHILTRTLLESVEGGERTYPIKLYSHMNITDSMKVYHWTDIRRRC